MGEDSQNRCCICDPHGKKVLDSTWDSAGIAFRHKKMLTTLLAHYRSRNRNIMLSYIW